MPFLGGADLLLNLVLRGAVGGGLEEPPEVPEVTFVLAFSWPAASSATSSLSRAVAPRETGREGGRRGRRGVGGWERGRESEWVGFREGGRVSGWVGESVCLGRVERARERERGRERDRSR